MDENKDFLRQDNNYRTLKAFQKAECIYDVTFYFANKYLKLGDRTIDQMVQGDLGWEQHQFIARQMYKARKDWMMRNK